MSPFSRQKTPPSSCRVVWRGGIFHRRLGPWRDVRREAVSHRHRRMGPLIPALLLEPLMGIALTDMEGPWRDGVEHR